MAIVELLLHLCGERLRSILIKDLRVGLRRRHVAAKDHVVLRGLWDSLGLLLCVIFSLKVLLNIALHSIVPPLWVRKHALHEVARAAPACRIARALHFGLQVVSAQTESAKVV